MYSMSSFMFDIGLASFHEGVEGVRAE
jgi:hypothetical protein